MKHLIYVTLLLATFESEGCKCSGLNLETLTQNSNKAYLGELVSTKVLSEQSVNSRQMAVIKTYVTIKGDVHKFEEVFTNQNSSCGARFFVSETYLVFEDENGYVDQCTMWSKTRIDLTPSTFPSIPDFDTNSQ